jgi:hypothetical protein
VIEEAWIAGAGEMRGDRRSALAVAVASYWLLGVVSDCSCVQWKAQFELRQQQGR